MKEKIIARFRAKFPAVNYSKKRLDELSAKLEAKITDENQIDAKLDEINEFTPFEEIAKADDKIVDLQNKLKPTSTTPAKDNPAPQPTPNPADEMPAWFKPFAEKIQQQEADKQQQSISQRVTAHDKLKEIPKSFYKGRVLPQKDDDIDAFVEGVVADHSAFLNEAGYSGIATHKPPRAEGGNPTKPKIDNDLVAFAKKQNEKAIAGK